VIVPTVDTLTGIKDLVVLGAAYLWLLASNLKSYARSDGQWHTVKLQPPDAIA